MNNNKSFMSVRDVPSASETIGMVLVASNRIHAKRSLINMLIIIGKRSETTMIGLD